MYCENCGHQLPDGARFCENCGAAVVELEDQIEPAKAATVIPPKTPPFINERIIDQVPAAIKKEPEITSQKVTENVYLCPDGKYRWVYEYQMLKNPAIIITVMKVLLLSFGIVFGFMALITLIGGDFQYWTASDFLSFFKGFFILLLVMLALGAISYMILGAVFGWSYQVLFTMDEDGVEMRQMRKDFQKSQAIGWLSAAAGLATGNVGQIGTGILAATRNSSSSVFQNVQKIKVNHRRHVIYVNQLLGHNQVYAQDADFDFVKKYIVDHCPNAKVK